MVRLARSVKSGKPLNPSSFVQAGMVLADFVADYFSIDDSMPDVVDVDGMVDTKGVRCIGNATRQIDGTWRCLANVGGALCIVEVSISLKRPSVEAAISE